MSHIPHLAEELIKLGTRCVFGIPGEGPSLLLLDELEKRGCSFQLVAHEAAGALAAAGFARFSGVPGVSLSIKGPGFSNMLSGIASNWLDRAPLLSLSESYGPGSSLHRRHKRLNHAAMVKPVVKAYADNVSSELLPKLWNLCVSEEPGPVHLDISHKMERSFADAEDNPDQTCGAFVPAVIANRLDRARRPVVIAGSLGTRRPWMKQLAKLRIPVFTTFAAKGAYDETLPYAAGVFTNSGGPVSLESQILPKADLVLGLGLRTTEILDVEPLPAPLIAYDELPGRSNGLACVEECLGSAGEFADAIERLGGKQWGEAELYDAREALEKKLAADEWLPAGVFRIAQDVLPESSIWVLDTGSFCTIGEHALLARRPLQVTGSALARSMGVAIPTAIGAALGAPQTPTIVVTGDGGMRMYPEALSLAARERLPILVLLMADGFLSSVRQSALKQGLSQSCLRVDSSCWGSVVRGWGIRSERLESLDAFEKAVKAWRTSPAPLLLELVFDCDRYAAMTEGIR
jgi:acetolactate synthase-1/2/3 large subunit